MSSGSSRRDRVSTRPSLVKVSRPQSMITSHYSVKRVKGVKRVKRVKGVKGVRRPGSRSRVSEEKGKGSTVIVDI